MWDSIVALNYGLKVYALRAAQSHSYAILFVHYKSVKGWLVDKSNQLPYNLIQFANYSWLKYKIILNLHDVPIGLCLTTGCISAASHILNAIDTSVQPCDDFYQFACGNFVKKTFIPDDKLTVDSFNTLSDQIDIQLRTIIEDEIDPNESRVFTLIKKLHRSCMNRTAVEARGLEPFVRIIQQIGGWPAVEGDEWNETAWDWIDSIHKMRKLGLTTNYLLSTSIGAHLKNSSTRSLRVINRKKI